MVNWLQEVENRKETLFEDLFRLLRIPSVREDDKATDEAPVGPGPKAALEEFMKMAQEDGFETKQFGPWAGRIEVGSGDELMGILGHVDVVPVGTGWETNPFEPVIKDNRIYARGSSDDKGPTVAAYFAIKLLRELGYDFNKRVHLIVGTDEESGWQCMDYYFQHAEMPDFGFSPDAVFPIINGEKGNVSFYLDFKSEPTEGDVTLVNFEGGLRENMVIQDVTATVKGLDNTVTEQFATFVNEHQLSGNAEWHDGVAEFKLVGKAAHGSTPEKGDNAATYLAVFLNEFAFNNKAAQDFITALATELHQDFKAEKVGVSHHHEVMGDVSMNVGIVSFNEADGGRIVLNFRFPEGTEPAMMSEKFTNALTKYQFNLTVGESKEPHYVPADDPLVATLLDVYTNQTGLEGHEMSIGGGTYGRLMPRGVAYGALFPDSIDTMHQANEFLAIDDLLRATAIYAEAIYRLTR